MSLGALIEQIYQDWMVRISKHTTYRALRVAFEMINGKYVEQYKHCRDYTAAIMTGNPRS